VKLILETNLKISIIKLAKKALEKGIHVGYGFRRNKAHT
jgi:hypothetical protein